MKYFALKIPGADGTPVEIQTPPGIPTNLKLGALISLFVQAALVFGIILALLYLVYGGFFWIQSKGNKETLDKARRIILYSIIGLIVMSLSFVIVSVISAALGVQTLIGGPAAP